MAPHCPARHCLFRHVCRLSPEDVPKCHQKLTEDDWYARALYKRWRGPRDFLDLERRAAPGASDETGDSSGK